MVDNKTFCNAPDVVDMRTKMLQDISKYAAEAGKYTCNPVYLYEAYEAASFIIHSHFSDEGLRRVIGLLYSVSRGLDFMPITNNDDEFLKASEDLPSEEYHKRFTKLRRLRANNMWYYFYSGATRMIEAGCPDRSDDLVDHYTAIKKLTAAWQNIQFPIFKDYNGIPILEFGWYANGDVIRVPIYTSTKETSLWFLYDEKDDLYKEVIFEEIESLIPKNSDDITRFEYPISIL